MLIYDLIVGMEKLETAQPHTCALGQSVNDQQILGSNSIEGKVAKRCQKDISHGLFFYVVSLGLRNAFNSMRQFNLSRCSRLHWIKKSSSRHINTVCSSPQSLHHEVPEPTNLDVVLSSLEDFWSGGQSWACRKRPGIATESAIAPYCGQHVIFLACATHEAMKQTWTKCRACHW